MYTLRCSFENFVAAIVITVYYASRLEDKTTDSSYLSEMQERDFYAVLGRFSVL